MEYCLWEDHALVKYIKQKGLYSKRKGNKIWKEMEKNEVLTGRTWQSMKQHFLKQILPGREQEFESTDDESSRSSSPMSRISRRSSNGGGKIYSVAEDKAIIKYILNNRRQNEVKGTTVWNIMADSNVVPGRTWQSLKERYVKRIIPNLSLYGLTEAQQRILKSPFEST